MAAGRRNHRAVRRRAARPNFAGSVALFFGVLAGVLGSFVLLARLGLVHAELPDALSQPLPAIAPVDASPAGEDPPEPEPTPVSEAPAPDSTPQLMEVVSTADPTAASQAEEALTDYLNGLEGVSVYCVRLSDGYTYEYNADADYYAASLLKAPYALWLCQRAEQGELDLNTTLPADGAAPQQSAAQAIHDMIAESDNDAAGQLYSTWPAPAQGEFARFLLTLGVDRPDNAMTTATRIHGNLSARDAGKIMQALYQYFATGTDTARQLETAFLDSDHPLLESDWPMAKKYGSWDAALHDMAIVYAEEPYCIAVLTSWGDREVDFPEPGASRITEIGNLAGELMQSAG